ncbi:F0F1 ATP synthase subunit A [Candidatus Peregrinibacteria bacterium]|nr:MAG: F0F1 ATP synthase subunit A [Candidatus Peregrinibacteria bacterium]
MSLSILPSTIAQIGPFAFTSAHAALLLVSVFIVLLAIKIASSADVIPTKLQLVMEMIIEWFQEKVDMATPKKYRKLNLYMVLTIFLMILFSNLLSYLPVLSEIEYNGEDLFFTPSAHLSLPLMLGILAVGLAQLIALVSHPFKHVGNYIKFHKLLQVRSAKDLMMAVIEVFLGLMDIIGEIAKMVSVSNRLFGNMLSGMLMSTVIIGLSKFTQFLAPTPFYALGLLSAVIQAIVFALLSGLFFGSTLQAVVSSKE